VRDQVTSNKLKTLYIRKRKRFYGDLQASNNRTIFGYNLTALVHIDVCMDIFLEYLTVFMKISEKDKVKLDEYNRLYQEVVPPLMDTLKSSTTDYEKAVESKSDESSLEILRNNVKLNINVLEPINALQGPFIDLYNQMWDFQYNILQNIYDSLIEIMQSDDQSVVLNVVDTLVKYIISKVVPGADELELLIELQKTIRENKERLTSAGDLLNELEAFRFSTITWCNITQFIIDSLVSLLEGKKSNIESKGLISLAGYILSVEKVKDKIETKLLKLGNTGSITNRA
jgi:hypothetical protein